uniref:class I SAM-dependent methyltransferase n=1 Tax=Alicyclobacillus shizuokensis TaxID=392014 RepID=UPI000B0BE21C
LKQLGYDWIEFHQGRAEELPFADEAFDAVVGVAFLHFTDRSRALCEMRRVVRPGGIVASYHPTKFTEPPKFFREWFAPLFDLAAKRNERPKDYLPYEEEVLDAFRNAGLQDIVSARADVTTLYHDPVKVVRHFMEGVGWFGEELNMLPWKARLDLVESLKESGRQVCNRYSDKERIIHFPNQMVKGYVPLV